MASIRRRNGKYQVQVRVNGCSASRTFSQLALARQWARDAELQAQRSTVQAPRYCPKNLSEIIQRYALEVTPRKSDPSSERYVLEAVQRAAISKIPLRSLTAGDFARYRDERLQQVAPSTIKRQFGILRAACRLARDEWDWESPVDVLRRVSLPRPSVTYVERVSWDDERRLLEAAGEMDRATLHDAIILALETAMRRSEIVKLQPEDVDHGRGLIVLRETKNGHPRLIPLSPRSRSVVVSRTGSDVPAVFSATKDGLKSAFRRARIRAGLPSVRFHDLRHEAISRLFDRGLTVPEVASISGHRDLSVLMRYSHADLERTRAKICPG